MLPQSHFIAFKMTKSPNIFQRRGGTIRATTVQQKLYLNLMQFQTNHRITTTVWRNNFELSRMWHNVFQGLYFKTSFAIRRCALKKKTRHWWNVLTVSKRFRAIVLWGSTSVDAPGNCKSNRVRFRWSEEKLPQAAAARKQGMCFISNI